VAKNKRATNKNLFVCGAFSAHSGNTAKQSIQSPKSQNNQQISHQILYNQPCFSQ